MMERVLKIMYPSSVEIDVFIIPRKGRYSPKNRKTAVIRLYL